MAEDVKLVLRYRVEANAPLAYQKPILLMEGDKRANVLQISLFDGEKPVDVTGLTVGGSVLRADGADVAIEGEIDGNVISCVLSEYAYAVAGPFKAFVQLLDSLGNVKRTVLLLAGMVESRGHGPQIDTGKELPSLDDILAQLETMRNVTQAANTAAGGANTAAAAANSAASKATGAANSATAAAGVANAAADRANDAAQNWEEGTVKNAEKLGGKPPEYYLTPVNLLDNSNFANPVAQAGLNGLHGASTYMCDRWISSNCNGTPGSGYLTVTTNVKSGRLTQHVSHDVAGKTVTLAIHVRSSVVMAYGIYYVTGGAAASISSSGTASDGFVILSGTLPQDATNVEFRLYPAYVDGGGAIDVYWAALYEGAYTAETLPPYVPLPYSVELATCQRYAVDVSNAILPGVVTQDGVCILFLPLPVGLRQNANPSVTLKNILYAYASSQNYALTFSQAEIQKTGVKLTFTCSSTVNTCVSAPDFNALIAANL